MPCSSAFRRSRIAGPDDIVDDRLPGFLHHHEMQLARLPVGRALAQAMGVVEGHGHVALATGFRTRDHGKVLNGATILAADDDIVVEGRITFVIGRKLCRFAIDFGKILAVDAPETGFGEISPRPAEPVLPSP